MKFPNFRPRLPSRKKTCDAEESPTPYQPRWDSFLREAHEAICGICFLRGLHKVFATGSCLPATFACHDITNAECRDLPHRICSPVAWMLWATAGFLALMHLRRDRLPFLLISLLGLATCGFAAAEWMGAMSGPLHKQ
ncbi:hypothetical protein GQX73_g10273 [Xylaria multiplex]|uniref:Uncharacterized protein n=1 Tax=Xylaria multiplex TaxID=323545 RepID=A0A7C8MXJ3_9PEZI|nr:hypothetical protein GQX73_g10273 [Xylaria multiplex]